MSIFIQRIFSAIISAAILITSGAGGAVQVTKDPSSETVTAVESYSEAAEALAGGARASVEGLEKDDAYPTIIIHGIGQASTYRVDEEGNPVYDGDGSQVTGWPIYFDVPSLVGQLAFPLLRSLITQKDNGLTKTAYKAVSEALAYIAYNEDGTPSVDFAVQGYGGRCVADCTQEEKDTIYDHVPLQEYAEMAGEDRLYYFAYNSFGDMYDIVDELEEIIEKAKRETGMDKVNLVPISLGGAVSVAYLDENPEGENINKVVFIVPATDGSEIVGKIMLGQLNYSDEGLYRDMFTKLLGTDKYTGWMINIVLRLLPKQVLKDLLAAVASGLTDGAVSKNTMMWGLVPGSMYDELAEKYLVDGTEFAARVEKFRQAQKNFVSNLKRYEENGVGLYNLCGFGLELYSLIDSDSSSDKIIHSYSTSIGATFSKVGETLPEDYVQQNYKDFNLISPDRRVDVSTCALPFTTWFFADQNHESIGHNDVVIRLASVILYVKDIDVYSTPAYPQFNGNRQSQRITELVKIAEGVDQTALDPETAAALQSALDAAKTNLNETVIVPGETEAAAAELENALIQAGALEAECTLLDDALLAVFKGLSEFLYDYYGPRGFTDPVTAIG